MDFYLIVFLILFRMPDTHIKNTRVTVCPTLKDYEIGRLLINGKKHCHIEPIGNDEQWIQEANCTVEKYKITTPDRYNLELRRMYCGTIVGTYPLLFGHGMGGNETRFFIGKSKSLGLIVLKKGYEVWMLNFRGTSSSSHLIYNKLGTSRFWRFSFHEMGVYDYPAAIKFIRNFHEKKYGVAKKLVLIGYGMGSTALTVFTSELPVYAHQTLVHQIHIAPIHSYLRVRPLLRVIATIWSDLKTSLLLLYKGQEMHLTLSRGTGDLCLTNKKTMLICQILQGAMGGTNLKVIDPEVYPFWAIHSDDFTSLFTVVHALQNIAYFGFRKYDNGIIGNKRKYDSIKPPKYNVSAINVNTTYFTSKNDGFANLKDTQEFYNNLPKTVQAGLHIMNPNKFCHLDYFAYNKYSIPQFIETRFLPVLEKINPIE